MIEPRIRVVPVAVRDAGQQITAIAAKGGIVLDEAQQMIAAATSGVGRDGRWSAFEAVIFSPRQNIKTEYLIARILAGLYLFGEELIVYSAHQARTTAKTFRRLKRAIESSPELGARITRVSNRAGAESIELSTGQVLECVARSTNSGRGFTGDSILLDESQDLDGEQLAAILPMLSTRRNPQILYALSLGNESSSHLGALRARALARQDPHVAWIEWSMAEGDRVDDRDVWKRCNPAHPERISLAYMEKEFLALGPEQFAKERLGKSNWPADDRERFAVISREAWEACEEHPADASTPVTPGAAFGVAVSRDGRSAAIGACFRGPDGLPVIDVVDHRPGDGAGWVGPRLAELCRKHHPVAVCWDDESLAGPLGLAGFVPRVAASRTKLITPNSAGLAQACGAFLYAFEQRAARHTGHLILGMAVGAARVRPRGPAWSWDDRGYDAEILQAATWALHAATSARPYDILRSVAGPT